MIALYIILAIVAIIVILFSIKVTVTAVYDETFFLDVKWLFINLRIYPEDEEAKAKKAAKKAEKDKKKNPKKEKPEEDEPETSSESKSNIFKEFYKNQGFAATIKLIKTAATQLGGFLKSVYKAFVIENLTVLLKVSAGDDAANTAIKYGKVCSAVYPSMGFICSNMKVKQYDVNVVPDFISAENVATFKLSLSVRPIKLTNAVIVLAFRLIFKVLLKLLTGSKNNNKSVSNTVKGGTTK
ncbi:MAG: DUF2953 domain-containing protein [Oscillospiraceae bacterium]|nr:DUF2953 domain-containing protein [Oscillospiraceae bacterium]